jgi:tetratricopeptide (TPR) repeat protein
VRTIHWHHHDRGRLHQATAGARAIRERPLRIRRGSGADQTSGAGVSELRRTHQLQGNLLQLAPAHYESQESPADCYRRALELNPADASVWEDLGFYLDALEDDFPQAMAAFERAILLGAGAESYYGLARALAQQGDRAKALDAAAQGLAKCLDDRSRRDLEQLEAEIRDGLWDPEVR